MQHRYREELPVQDLKFNVVVAAFVTSFERMELYQGMNIVEPGRWLYIDSDSIFSFEGSGLETIPTGKCLSNFKDELVDNKITKSICAGAKSYYYKTKTGKEVFRAKGLAPNWGNSNVSTESTFLEPCTKQQTADPHWILIEFSR